MSKPTDGMNVTAILVVGLLSFGLLFVVVVGTTAAYYVVEERMYERKVVNQAYEPLQKTQREQKAQLEGGKTPDGRPTIGINQAMEIVIEQRGAR